MTFEKILENIDCDCIADTGEDTINIFLRVLKKGHTELEDADLYTHYEIGVKPKNVNCDSICSNRGWSIELLTDENKEDVFVILRTKFGISPGLKSRYAAMIRFKSEAGKMKQYGGDINHYDFFKSDDFNKTYLEILNNIDLGKDD